MPRVPKHKPVDDPHAPISLERHGISVTNVCRNFEAPQLYEEAIRYDSNASISDRGALIAYSGDKTGRSPKDKRIVRHPDSQDDIWWGPINIPVDEHTFEINRERALDYLNIQPKLYVVDAFAGWSPENRLKVRLICSRPYHALFMYTMLIRPSDEELAEFGEPEFVIYNAGRFPANRHTEGMTSKTSVDISFENGQMVILGTEYAGEMKKGVFTVMNYLMPKKGILSMHCSATADPKTGRSSVLFGLSGTGKTTLSSDPTRRLIGDDEHCWDDKGIWNIEGGCYAKAIYLSREREPDIFDALRFGAVLENVVYDEAHHHVDFDNATVTENTRGAYPIEYIRNAKIPCVAGHPTDVIFLTCDAFGVLPPISRLDPGQAMYHFISGYTAKVAGTEVGVDEPEATFSPCFGGPFLVWHPGKYAEMLAERMAEHGSKVWLVNTGWTGGAFGTGERISLRHTRSIIDAIHQDSLHDTDTQIDPVFKFRVVTDVPGVPSGILVPRQSWKDAAAYDKQAAELAKLFNQNFKKYADDVGDEVRAADPQA